MRHFESTPWHTGMKFANTESEFMPTDTKETLQRLCQVPEYREYFSTQGWLEPGAITYKINSFGFRCDEFDDRDCIIALGCSYTMGIGLPVHVTWPQLVGRGLNLVPYTLAWGGASADTCFRLAEYWIPALKPKAVFMLAPPPSRFDLVKAVGHPPVETYMPQSESHSVTEVDSFLQHWFTMDENSRLNQKKNKLAIQALCAESYIPFVVHDALDYMALSREAIGYARDCMHGGPIAHQRVAERMIDDWRKKHS